MTRYEDIWTVDKETETFTSEEFVNLEDVDAEFMDLRRSILETDGPRHQAMRALIAREFSPRNLMKNYEGFLRELTKQTVDEALRAERVRLRREDQRRLPDPGAGPTARRTPGGHRPADRVGQRDGRQHRPRLHRSTRSTRRRARSTSTCRSARRRLRTSSTTDGLCATAQGRRRHRPGQPARQQDPHGRRPAQRQRLRQLLPAPRHRRQRDHASRDQQLHARADATSATSCGRCRRTRR